MAEPGKKRRFRWLSATSAAMAFGAGAIAIGPGAPWLVDHLADGQRVWRLGRIQVGGVSGAWLGDLRAAHLTLADDEGVWLEAEDVSLRWRPQDLLGGAFTLDAARAAEISILRRPALSAPRSSKGAIDAHLRDIHVDRLALSEPVVGTAAQFDLTLALNIEGKALTGLDVGLRRIDADLDRITAHYDSSARFALDVDAFGAAGGVLSRALGVPEHAVAAHAEGSGGEQRGAATFSALVGNDEALNGDVSWDNERWRTQLRAHLAEFAPLRTLARRVGGDITATASGERNGAFTARAQSNFLTLTLNGASSNEEGLRASFTATTTRLSDIARESPFELGAARLEGEVRRARGTTAIQATLDATDINALGRSARFTGPVRAALDAEAFKLTADLRAPDNSPALLAQSRLRTELRYDRGRQRFALEQAELTSDSLALDGQGWATRGDGEFAGAWRVRRLEALAPDVAAGQAAGSWRAFTEPSARGRVWATSVNGVGVQTRGANATLAQMIGAAPRIDARFRYENRGITVSHARIDGAQARVGATGRIVRGQTDLALEASARGPITLGETVLTGAGDATGRMTGPIARPSLELQATLAGFEVGGVLIEAPIVDFTLAPRAGAYAGAGRLRGVASGQPLTGAADIESRGGALTFSNLEAQWGGLLAQGEAALASAGVRARLEVNGALDGLAAGVSGRVAGALTLNPDAMQFDARLVDARFGLLRARQAHISAEGPPDALSARVEMQGRLGQAPLAFQGAARMRRERGLSNLDIEGDGTLAQTTIATRAPMRITFDDRHTEAALDVRIGDGALRGEWREQRRTLSGAAYIEDAPLAPLAAIWGERAVGRIDGDVRLANAGAGLEGEADLALTGARFAGRQRETLDLRIAADLSPSRLTSSIDASSADGLTAHFEADAPVNTSAAPLRIALAPERRGRATWSVRGSAESLWAAARLPDQALAGQLEGAGEISFGAGHLSGDGHIQIVDGRFEDKLTGVSLQNLDARLGLSANGVLIERFSATGPHGGRITATGGSANPNQGRIAVAVADMRIVDRPDARAVASGDLVLAWEGLHSTLSGALAISESELDVAANPEAGIATLDVIEVNRPDGDDEAPTDAPAHRNGSADIDVRITAPGRVFTRGRGVDAEWSLDLRLDGTAREPRLFGEARAVRGTLALSGQPFEIDSARIFFNGDPLDAQIDMSAVRDTADLSARIRLTGTAREPEIAFSSDPPLPEDEILPQVLFGRGVADLSAFEAAQLAASLAALSGNASLNLMDAARAAAGLDRFNVRQDQDGGFLVAGGVYLTRDVYVELARTGLGQAQTRVEWTVRPRLVLVTSFRGDGDQRISLRWRRESD